MSNDFAARAAAREKGRGKPIEQIVRNRYDDIKQARDMGITFAAIHLELRADGVGKISESGLKRAFRVVDGEVAISRAGLGARALPVGNSTGQVAPTTPDQANAGTVIDTRRRMTWEDDQ